MPTCLVILDSYMFDIHIIFVLFVFYSLFAKVHFLLRPDGPAHGRAVEVWSVGKSLEEWQVHLIEIFVLPCLTLSLSLMAHFIFINYCLFSRAYQQTEVCIRMPAQASMHTQTSFIRLYLLAYIHI